MADLDNTDFATAGDDDPAADFFAREQDQLASLEDDGFGGELEGDVGQETAESVDFLASSEPTFDPFLQDASPPELAPSIAAQEVDVATLAGITEAVPTLGAGLLNPFADMGESYQLLSDATVTASSTDNDMYSALGNDFNSEPVATEGIYSSISQADRQGAEPEKIQIWREEQKLQLQQKDIESDKKAGEWRERAQHELDEWYRHREEQLAKTRLNNKEHENALISERDETVPGHEWERICRLCEFNPKQSGNKKDIARMRSILLQLKQTPLQKTA